MKSHRWIYAGLSAISCMFGYLTGVSNAPIAGTVVSSIFGGVIGLAAGFATGKGEEKDDSEFAHLGRKRAAWVSPRTSGIALLCVAAFFVTGTMLGGLARVYWPLVFSPHLVIPWHGDKLDAPTTPEDAWRWLTFSRDASRLGLGPNDIVSLYRRYTAVPHEAEVHELRVFEPTWPSYKPVEKSGESSTKADPTAVNP